MLPFIVLVVALAGSDYLYFAAADDDVQDTSAINRGTIDVQEYFNEKLREGVIDRIGQPIKATDDPVHLGTLSGSLADQGQQILSAMGAGALTPSQATTMLQAIAAQSRIIEADELEQRVKKLEDAG